ICRLGLATFGRDFMVMVNSITRIRSLIHSDSALRGASDLLYKLALMLGKIPTETKVVVTTAIKFHSEYRVYVRDGEILNICFYKGNPLIQPNVTAIQKMVTATKDYAVAYGLDVGVIENGRTALVETNDFCCLGNYGLKAIEYAKCIADRWPEVWGEFRG
ncbi:MAG: ATP-grasp domain-containing protein, partial [Cyanobacteria bacterium P01_C01_bin.89]